VKVGRREIDVSNRDKVFFPDSGVTKGDLVDYYHRIADTFLPHARDRPVSMERFPDGIAGDSFFQKDVPDYFPGWIRRVEIEKENGTLHQLVIDDAATLVYLADQGCVTPHVWLSRSEHIRRPDRLIVDFDPPGDDPDAYFDEVRWAARTTRSLLEELDLVPFVQTSGSRGLHIHVPLNGDEGFDTVRHFAMDLADLLARRHPERLTTAHRKAKREGRIFLDVLRNAYAQTSVAPYAVRARAGAPVATPLAWDELDRSGLGPVSYTVENIFRRLGQRDDPWSGMGRHGRSLSGPRQALNELLGEAGLDPR
jgi:bifunctional non-homologous end joining protein LigD